MQLWAAYGIAGAAGGGVGALAQRAAAGDGASVERAAVALVVGGVADVITTSAVLAAFGVRPSFLVVGLIGLGSMLAKHAAGNVGASSSPGRVAAIEGIGAAGVGLLLGSVR